jgi:hypothetical protein
VLVPTCARASHAVARTEKIRAPVGRIFGNRTILYRD